MQFVIIEIEGEEPVVLPAVLLERDVRVSIAMSSADPSPRPFVLRVVDGAIVAVPAPSAQTAVCSGDPDCMMGPEGLWKERT